MARPGYLIGCAIAGLFAVSVIPGAALASGSCGNLNFVFGQKRVNEQDWLSSDPGIVGIDVMWGDDRWPVMIQAYFAGSGASGSNAFDESVNEYTNEFGIGLAKVWAVGHFHPYLSGGGATITINVDRAPVDGDVYASSSGAGGWASSGGFFRLAHRINLGAFARYSVANATLEGSNRSLGGWQYGLILGWAWPASD